MPISLSVVIFFQLVVALSNHNKKYDKMTNLHSIRLHNFRHSNEVVNLIDNLNEES